MSNTCGKQRRGRKCEIVNCDNNSNFRNTICRICREDDEHIKYALVVLGNT